MDTKDFDELGIYKGFVKNQKGKKYPGRNPKLLSLLEVDEFDSLVWYKKS